jgi:hypothetical protein
VFGRATAGVAVGDQEDEFALVCRLEVGAFKEHGATVGGWVIDRTRKR